MKFQTNGSGLLKRILCRIGLHRWSENWYGTRVCLRRGCTAINFYFGVTGALRWMRERYTENNIEAILLGITWDESYQRRYLIIRYGDSYTTKKHQSTAKHKVYPIAFWTEEEVWRYIRENNIPYNKIYDRGAKRCGCAPCTSYLNWDENMAKLSPGLFRKVLHDQGGTQLSDFGEQKP